ncbi:MAG TPA: undecaprenyl-diphosphatase UppP [Chloroflexi bacterium]|jgi:undecaprenyl-diphosphatase|nr:undecaprenyl-diphosphatase UppP [Anaerolineaceae bacterium]HHX09309.1 undecaprenyl-diphosphatase UppP [Chloroflexota bacterium]
MTFIQSIVLGIIQGLTEFLPISSSAHLVILPYLLNWSLDPQKAFFFDVLVQLGTLVAVIAYFWKDLVQIFFAVIEGIKSKAPFKSTESRLGWYIVLGTIPAGLAGLLLKDRVEAAFNSPVLTAVLLFVTAILLVLAEIFSKKEKGLDHLNPLDSVLIGLFQALAIFPGISRSGATISGGLFKGYTREAAARFSFLLSIPIMLAAGLLSVVDLVQAEFFLDFLPTMLLGFLIAGIVGYFSIKWLLGYLRRNTLFGFALYCALLSVITIFVASIR